MKSRRIKGPDEVMNKEWKLRMKKERWEEEREWGMDDKVGTIEMVNKE